MSKRKCIGGHQSAAMRTDQWLTPPEIISSLGKFDLDPCSPVNRPWDTADHHYTIQDDGLTKPWFGRVWCNPPYGSECVKWMRLNVQHDNSIALIFARTETSMFFETVWGKADSMFFFDGRLYFYDVNGVRAKANAGAPSCLISYGQHNAQAIEDSGLKGKHLPLNAAPVIVIGVSPSWKSVINIVMVRSGGEADLKTIYDMVEIIAPDKVRSHSDFKAKIRQRLQQHFNWVREGVYSIS